MHTTTTTPGIMTLQRIAVLVRCAGTSCDLATAFLERFQLSLINHLEYVTPVVVCRSRESMGSPHRRRSPTRLFFTHTGRARGVWWPRGWEAVGTRTRPSPDARKRRQACGGALPGPTRATDVAVAERKRVRWTERTAARSWHGGHI
jgi:hypothetical protein